MSTNGKKGEKVQIPGTQYWRTPLYNVGHDESDQSKKKVVASVPNSGLFGFIFGHRNHTGYFEEQVSGKGRQADGNPKHCGCTYRAKFTLVRSDESAYNESIMLPLSTSKAKVLTSSRVAKAFYLPKGTDVLVERVSSCKSDIPCEWVWGLVLQKKFDERYAEKAEESSGKVENTESTSPPKKKVKKSADNQNELSDSRKIFDMRKIYFNPIQSTKKPLLCTKCCRKFCDSQSIENHYKSAHAPKLGDIQDSAEHDDDYSDLIGPKIFRTPLKVAYEDDDLVIVVKPQGVPVQGGKWTLPRSDLLMPFVSKLKREGNLAKPRITHRLDSATGGLLVVAKTLDAERKIKKCFEERLCKKRYRAIVFGKLIQNQHRFSELDAEKEEDEHTGMGIINVPLSGKTSLTRYKIVSHTRCDDKMANGFITTVDLYPMTGRQHQLRKHLKMIDHPIIGDLRYASYSKEDKIAIQQENNKFTKDVCNKIGNPNIHSKMCLWALEISFPHPSNNELVHTKLEEPACYENLRLVACARIGDMQ